MEPVLAQTSSPGARAAPEAGKAATLNSDYETFLRMLTVQMRNQDPLNPVDSAEFSLQLATFSALEQQVLTNDLLKELAAGLAESGLGGYSRLLGAEVLAKGPVSFQGAPVTLHAKADPDADRAALVIKDQSGTALQRITLDLPIDTIEWAGATDDGGIFPYGTYDIRIESYSGSELLSDTPVASYGTVSELRKDSGQTMVVLSSGQEIAAEEIEGLRDKR